MSSHREIERKFLVKSLPPDLHKFPHRSIAQGYIIQDSAQGVVRVRKKGSKHYLTVKRRARVGKEETEVRITAKQFEQLWPLTKGRRLNKVRYEIPFGNRTIELDVFCGRHNGLVLAEVEFPNARAARSFKPPEWFLRDVSSLAQYGNSRLALQPEVEEAVAG
jgi:CYTH domain-containing protein